jgi:phage shock protein C
MAPEMEKTLNISQQDLHSTLNEFLEEKEKKPAESIWNITTVSGLVFVLLSATFVGHTVGTEIMGWGIPFIETVMRFAPYVGGAMLGVIILSMFKRSKKKEIEEYKEQEKVKETYDKLDEFLYKDKKKGAKTSSKNSYDAFRVETSNKLTKSRTDKKIAGVCGGLAKHLGISSTVMRLIFVAAVFLSSSTFILVYIALAFVMPKEPVYEMDDFK